MPVFTLSWHALVYGEKQLYFDRINQKLRVFVAVDLTLVAVVIICTHGGDRSPWIGRDGYPTAILCQCQEKTLTESRKISAIPPNESLRWINLDFSAVSTLYSPPPVLNCNWCTRLVPYFALWAARWIHLRRDRKRESRGIDNTLYLAVCAFLHIWVRVFDGEVCPRRGGEAESGGGLVIVDGVLQCCDCGEGGSCVAAAGMDALQSWADHWGHAHTWWTPPWPARWFTPK